MILALMACARCGVTLDTLDPSWNDPRLAFLAYPDRRADWFHWCADLVADDGSGSYGTILTVIPRAVLARSRERNQAIGDERLALLEGARAVEREAKEAAAVQRFGKRFGREGRH